MSNILTPVISQIIMLFMMAGIGLFLRKRRIFTDEVIKGVNATVLNVTWPCIALMAMLVDYTPEVLSGFFTVMITSIIIMCFACLLGFLVFNRMKDKLRRPVLICLSCLPNAGFVGMPIAQALYGELGVLYMAAFLVGFNLLAWTAGTSMFTGFGLKTLKGFLSPACVAILIGLVIFLLKIKLPEAITSTITSLGRMNTPLAMLMMGARMDTLSIADILNKRLWAAVSIKLLIVPLVLFAGLKLMGFTGILLTLPVLLAGMPSASSCQMMAEKYDADSKFAAKGVSICTLCCIISLPILALVAG